MTISLKKRYSNMACNSCTPGFCR